MDTTSTTQPTTTPPAMGRGLTEHGITSRPTLPSSGDYRHAFVGGRKFGLSRHTYRAGRKYDRYTATEWTVTERDPATGRYIATLERSNGGRSSTIAAAHALIAAYVVQLRDGGDAVVVKR